MLFLVTIDYVSLSSLVVINVVVFNVFPKWRGFVFGVSVCKSVYVCAGLYERGSVEG